MARNATSLSSASPAEGTVPRLTRPPFSASGGRHRHRRSRRGTDRAEQASNCHASDRLDTSAETRQSGIELGVAD
jgi:hypothetical protein